MFTEVPVVTLKGKMASAEGLLKEKASH